MFNFDTKMVDIKEIVKSIKEDEKARKKRIESIDDDDDEYIKSLYEWLFIFENLNDYFKDISYEDCVVIVNTEPTPEIKESRDKKEKDKGDSKNGKVERGKKMERVER